MRQQASGLHTARRRPVARALAALLGLASLDTAAAPAVTNCNDTGAGSLRDAVAGASSGEVIELSGLPCSTISLTSGAIAVMQNDLTISGPGSDALEISAKATHQSNVITHYGAGTLAVDNLKVTYGHLYMSSSGKYFGGGCIGSLGNLTLDGVVLDKCQELLGDNADGRGGAVFALGSLHLNQSTISSSGFGTVYVPVYCYYTTYGPYGGAGTYCQYRPSIPGTERGGGMFSVGGLNVNLSTISANSAGLGGGIYAAGAALVKYSTLERNIAGSGGAIATAGKGTVSIFASNISQNQTDFFAGGDSTIEGKVPSSGTPMPIRILNSTLSGNSGSMVVKSAIPVTIYNSTLALNYGGAYALAEINGVVMTDAPLTAVSSIIADNSGSDVILNGSATISGSNNLINFASSPLPPDTVSACPQLAPLADNGGPTRSLALRATSPAIDGGADPMLLADDQRGENRTFGSAIDIGAYEWSGDIDRIFVGRFDGSRLSCDI